MHILTSDLAIDREVIQKKKTKHSRLYAHCQSKKQ